MGHHDHAAMTMPDPAADQGQPPAATGPAGAAALSIAGISHSYGPRRALADINFEVQPASFTALLGLNGAGKSTLFSLITRLFGIQTGHISIFGHDISREPDPREQLDAALGCLAPADAVQRCVVQ